MEDESQTRAIEADINLPLLIEAGPGSGKTFTVIRRAQYILEQTQSCTADARQCLGLALITFSNNAAAEMRTRLMQLLDLSILPKHIVVATFHSYALRLVRKYHRKLGYTMNPDIISSGKDRMAILQEVLKGKQYASILAKISDDEAKRRYLGALLEHIRQAKGELDFTKTVSLFDAAGIPISLFSDFQNEMKTRNQIMFDDMLMFGFMLLEEPEVLSNVANCHRHFLVDEFQDTNFLQLAFLSKIFLMDRVMFTIVGDADQLIYRYMGAQKANFSEIMQLAKARRLVPTVVRLRCNYRSTDKIVRLCNQLVDAERDEGAKKAMVNAMELWGLDDSSSSLPIRLVSCPDIAREKECVLSTIVSLASGTYGGPPIAYGDMCVLYRLNEQGRELKEYLSARIPFVKFITKAPSSSPSGDQESYCEPSVQLFIGKLRMAMSGGADVGALGTHCPRIPNRDFDRLVEEILPAVRANVQRSDGRHLLDVFLEVLASTAKSQKRNIMSTKEKNLLKRWCDDVKALENAIAIGDLTFTELCFKAVSDRCLQQLSKSVSAYSKNSDVANDNDDEDGGDSHFQRCVTSLAIAYDDSAIEGTNILTKLDGFLTALGGLVDRSEGFLFLEMGLKEFSKGGASAASSSSSSASSSNSSSSTGMVTLSTIHKAKGLEWRAVIVYHASTDCFGGTSNRLSNDPSDQLAAEEDDTNLLYVALSRPSQVLFITYLDDEQTGVTRLLRPCMKLVEHQQFLGSTGEELAALKTAAVAGSHSGGHEFTSHSKKRKM